MAQTGISPREFLKQRKPEKFSDSVSREVPILDRSLLEYHLETLTSRSQENDFENFARRLAENEICPNLLPHTGPTGGGDSKVDAETYPIADSLSLVWFIGMARDAASERWVFAFSAKKKWKPKVESDVDKIVSTDRGYQKVFFITNQFVADRVRAQVEDNLRKKHKIDIRILDRTWILDRVFNNKREALAISELKIKTDVRVQRRLGPLDTQKESELEEVEKRIEHAAKEAHKTPALADDCLRSIELARELELPRTDVEGRLLRLKRVVEECGTSHQKFVAEYAWAWTAFWWFEDYSAFMEHYTEVEKRSLGTTNVYQVELHFNLWCNLSMVSRCGKLSAQDAELSARTQTLTEELNRLAQEEEKPSSALHAETLMLLMNMVTAPLDQTDKELAKAADIIDRSLGLVGFPFEPLIQILTELGKHVGDSPAYDALHDNLVNAVATRKGDIAAARLLVQRAAQALDDNRPYVAIQSAGKALARLYKHETRGELVEALYICGNAYDQVGLTWAARGTVLTAASVAVNEFWTYDEITPEQALCLARIRWFELRLGRLPHCLAWHETAQAAEVVLRHRGFKGGRALGHTILFDTCLSVLLLKADLRQLKELSRLPDALDSLQLRLAAATLRFALGHEYHLPTELEIKDAERDNFFYKLRNQPAAQQMPRFPQLCDRQKVAWESRVLGCHIIVNADNRSPCLELAESLLAALEALLATGISHQLFAHEAQITMNIRRSDFAKFPFRFDFGEKDGTPFIEISIANFNHNKLSRPLQNQLQDKLTEVLVEIIARFFVVEFSEERLKNFIVEELALDRAVYFTSSFVSLGNVLGHSPKTTLNSWVDDGQADYSLMRSKTWDADQTESCNVSFKQEADLPAPRDKNDWQTKTPHDKMEMLSLIRIPLWDKACWAGVAYLGGEANRFPPGFALAFSNGSEGKKIFALWRKEIGIIDEHNRLRLSIIRGITKRNAYAYRVVIGANPQSETIPEGSPKLFFMMSRINTMEPSSDVNLRTFIESYRAVGGYALMPALSHGASSPPEMFCDHAILMRHIEIREAWEIGPNDVDACGIQSDDDPIIPDRIGDPPVLQLLKRLRGSDKRSNPS